MNDSSEDPASWTSHNPQPPFLSGRLVVLGMLGFGIVMTAALYVYWEQYTRPFRGLQSAIAAKFPQSLPRVVGGKHKSHRPDSPSILRIIVRTRFNPSEQSTRARKEANALADLAREHADLTEYQLFHLVLMYRRPERATIMWSVQGPLDAFPLRLEGDLPEEVELDVTKTEQESRN